MYHVFLSSNFLDPLAHRQSTTCYYPLGNMLSSFRGRYIFLEFQDSVHGLAG